jgi:spore coat polysaccharide biosynthesis protein SpsF
LKVVAIIQARMGSTRLPGKVLLTLCGKSVLAHVIGRAKAAPGIDEVVVATTTLRADDAVAAEAERAGACIHRGSESDVLSRYHGAAKETHADTVVRLTADCPMLDPELVGVLVRKFVDRKGRIDYLSNTLVRTYPRGLDAEVFSMAALERAWREATLPDEREHVTPYIYRHPETFRLENHAAARDDSDLRITLDTPEDWIVIQRVSEALGGGARIAPTAEVLQFLRNESAVSR